MASIPERIRTIMNLLEMSAPSVAEKGDISADSVKSILKGQSKNPGAEILKGLSKAFNLSIDYMVSDEKISLETLTGHRAVSGISSTQQLDIELYREAIIALEDSARRKGVNISDPALRKYYINQIYDFSYEHARRNNTLPKVDVVFVDWIIGKMV